MLCSKHDYDNQYFLSVLFKNASNYCDYIASVTGVWSVGRIELQGETDMLGDKPIPVLHSPQQVPPFYRTWPSEVRSRRLSVRQTKQWKHYR